ERRGGKEGRSGPTKGMMKEVDLSKTMRSSFLDYSMSVIYERTLNFEIPTNDLFELFVFVLSIEKYVQENPEDEIFVGDTSEDRNYTIIARVNEYQEENPDVFCDIEIYDRIFEVDPDLYMTPTYQRILNMFYEDIIEAETIASLSLLLKLYTDRCPLSEKYIELVKIPSKNLDVFKEAFHLFVNNPRQDATIKKRFSELRQIIETKYSSDEELKRWCQQNLATSPAHKNNTLIKNKQEFGEKAVGSNETSLYKVVKWGSLLLAILFVFIKPILGIVLAIAWGVCFFTKVHDIIPFLRDGKQTKDGNVR
ncbi:MAG: hypothetical protein MJZ76_06585, partial [Bacteroidales bacterium]|nr:hypothetical protein [Bacteroidales bacterium]